MGVEIIIKPVVPLKFHVIFCHLCDCYDDYDDDVYNHHTFTNTIIPHDILAEIWYWIRHSDWRSIDSFLKTYNTDTLRLVEKLDQDYKDGELRWDIKLAYEGKITTFKEHPTSFICICDSTTDIKTLWHGKIGCIPEPYEIVLFLRNRLLNRKYCNGWWHKIRPLPPIITLE